MWIILWKWAKQRHSNKGHKWIVSRYSHTVGSRNWVFQTKTNKIIKFSDAHIRRHHIPKLKANPYLDRDYFLERKERIKKYTPWIQTRPTLFTFHRPTNG